MENRVHIPDYIHQWAEMPKFQKLPHETRKTLFERAFDREFGQKYTPDSPIAMQMPTDRQSFIDRALTETSTAILLPKLELGKNAIGKFLTDERFAHLDDEDKQTGIRNYFKTRFATDENFLSLPENVKQNIVSDYFQNAFEAKEISDMTAQMQEIEKERTLFAHQAYRKKPVDDQISEALTAVGSTYKEMGKQVPLGILDMVAGVSEGVGLFQKAVTGEVEPNALMRGAERIREFGNELFPANPEYAEDMAVQLTGALTSLSMFLAPTTGAAKTVGGIGKALNYTDKALKTLEKGATWATAGTIAGMMGMSETEQNIRQFEEENDDVQLTESMRRFFPLAGLLPGIVQVGSLGFLLRRIPAPMKGKAAGWLLKNMAMSGISEFSVETAGAVIQDALRSIYDDEHSVMENLFANFRHRGTPASIASAMLVAIMSPFKIKGLNNRTRYFEHKKKNNLPFTEYDKAMAQEIDYDLKGIEVVSMKEQVKQIIPDKHVAETIIKQMEQEPSVKKIKPEETKEDFTKKPISQKDIGIFKDIQEQEGLIEGLQKKIDEGTATEADFKVADEIVKKKHDELRFETVKSEVDKLKKANIDVDLIRDADWTDDIRAKAKKQAEDMGMKGEPIIEGAYLDESGKILANYDAFVSADGKVDFKGIARTALSHEMVHKGWKGVLKKAQEDTKFKEIFEKTKAKYDAQGVTNFEEAVAQYMAKGKEGDVFQTLKDWWNRRVGKQFNVTDADFMAEIQRVAKLEGLKEKRIEAELEAPPAKPAPKAEPAEKVKFWSGGDAVGKEYHGWMAAYDKVTGKKIGHVDYSDYKGKTAVKMIEVAPEFQRKGYGTILLDKLQSESKTPIAIQGNFATKEGGELWKKWKSPKVEKPAKKVEKKAKAAQLTAEKFSLRDVPPEATKLPEFKQAQRELDAAFEYRGHHTAPTSEFGAPGHDMIGFFPEDIYSPKGAQYYGHHGRNHPMDVKSVNIIQSMRGKPNKNVAIYRAVPYDKTNAEMIDLYEQQKKQILNRGKMPDDAVRQFDNVSDYYDFISDEITRLSKLPETQQAELKINKGDWVTINRDYAKEHGESVLDGKYKILKKVVKAKEIFNNADSIHEWGYEPGTAIMEAQDPKFSVRQKTIIDKMSLSIKKTAEQAEQPSEQIEITDTTKGEQLKKVENLLMELQRARLANIGIAMLRANRLSYWLETNLKPAERELLPFIIEQTDVPLALKRKDLEDMMKNEKVMAKLRPIADDVRTFFENAKDYIAANTDMLSDQMVENYITHMWDLPKNITKKEYTHRFRQRADFLTKRHIATLFEGIENEGLTPKTLDTSKIIKVYTANTVNAIENVKILNAFKNVKVMGIPLAIADEAGDMRKLAQVLGYEKYGMDTFYEKIRMPIPTKEFLSALKKATITKKPMTFTKEDIKQRIKWRAVARRQLWVHPELKKHLNTLLEKPALSGNLGNILETMGQIFKKTQLTISLFHPAALVETAVGVMGWKSPRVLKKQRYVFNNMEIAEDAIKHNLQLGATQDIIIQRVQSLLDDATRKAPVGLKQVLGATSFLNKKWDTMLWDILHDNLKILGYQDIVTREQAATGKTLTTAEKRTIAQFCNDSFGGQNWELFLKSPKTMQILRFALLSPDWTVSTIRQALALTGFGEKNPNMKFLRRKLGRRFWFNVLLYFGAGMNMLNMLFRKWDEEKNPEYYENEDMTFWKRTMLGNPFGRKTYLFAGRYSDGTERYIRWGKQFREFPELLFDSQIITTKAIEQFSPLSAIPKKLGGKASPLAQISAQALTGKTLSGFSNRDIDGQEGWNKAWGLIRLPVKSLIPFAATKLIHKDQEFGFTDFVAPSTKGLTKWRTIKLFEKSMEEYWETGDESTLKQIYWDAHRNNLDAAQLMKTALSNKKRELTKEIRERTDDIKKVTEQIYETDDPAIRKRLVNYRKDLIKRQRERENVASVLQVRLPKVTRDLDQINPKRE